MTTFRASRRALLGALAGLALAGTAAAQAYPTKPVRIVVSFAAGGGVDMMARVLAEQLGKQMGQTFVVENKPGASGTIGADFVAKSAADGYTLLAGGNPELTFMQAINEKLPYQPLRDLTPLVLVARVPSVLVVPASSPIRSLAQFMERARSEPGLPYGTPGRGTGMHLAFELMNQLHGTKLVHVPYKGGGPATTDVVAGQIDAAVINLPPLLPHIRSGKLRALAVLQDERSAQLPDVPTMKEGAGIADIQASAWFALSLPAGVPADIRGRLESEVRKALALPELKGQLAKGGLDVVALPGARMGEIIAAEAVYNAGMVKRLGYKPE